jgi:hypothetical protein
LIIDVQRCWVTFDMLGAVLEFTGKYLESKAVLRQVRVVFGRGSRLRSRVILATLGVLSG